MNKSIIFISALSLFIACATLAQDRMVYGNISIYEPSLQTYDSNTKILNVGHYKQTTDYTCGPAAVMNLMYFYNMLTAKDMNRQTEMRISMEMDASKAGGGTTESQVVSWLGEHGFYVDAGQMVSADFLINNINNGHPVIIAYNNHWMVANGYENASTSDNTYIFFSDTGVGHTRIKRTEIDSMWAISRLRYRNSNDVGYYILAVPYNKTR